MAMFNSYGSYVKLPPGTFFLGSTNWESHGIVCSVSSVSSYPAASIAMFDQLATSAGFTCRNLIMIVIDIPYP